MTRLRRAIDEAERIAPLPRCVHGNCLMDGGGEALEPPCGCRLHDGPKLCKHGYVNCSDCDQF